MFFRVSAICTYALVGMAAFAAAEPVRRGGAPPPTVTVTAPASTATTPASQCSTGDLQCCNSVQNPNDPVAAALLGLLGIVVQGVDVLVGLTCDPITVIGVGGDSCNQQTVCCENNNFSGLINIGCTPVNINL